MGLQRVDKTEATSHSMAQMLSGSESWYITLCVYIHSGRRRFCKSVSVHLKLICCKSTIILKKRIFFKKKVYLEYISFVVLYYVIFLSKGGIRLDFNL